MASTIILTKAHILTLDPVVPRAESLIIRDGKILDVGDEDALKRSLSGDFEEIDCRGRTVVPGFIDAHFHLQAFAESLINLDLSPAVGIGSISDIQAAVEKRARVLPPGAWIRAGGYNEFYLAEKRHPDRWDLDQAASNHPVKLTHRSGHAHVLSSSALKLAGISIETPEPPGGLIERGLETGAPTGLLFGMGQWLAERIPPLGERELTDGIKRADQELVSLGVTSIQDASVRNDMGRWSRLQQWKDEGIIKCRVSMMLGARHMEESGRDHFLAPAGENQVRLSGVKIIVDQTTGRLNPGREELNELVLAVHRSGRQAAVHAFEETSIEAACSAIESALDRFPRPDHRHRIEHCAVCPPSLAGRLARLGIMVVTQPAFVYYHGQRYLKTVAEEEIEHLYPLATLIQSGVLVAAGSDGPIVPANPLVGLYAAVSRTADTGKAVLPKERISRIEALKLYTEYAARAGFEEEIKGSIRPGKLADLAVLSGDPTSLPPEEIKDVKVEMTIINGEKVWERAAG